MAYEDEVRRADTYVERKAGSSSYLYPVIALLVFLGLGAWFASSYRTAPDTTVPTTIERTAPAPSTPVIPSPAPSIPTPAPTPTPK